MYGIPPSKKMIFDSGFQKMVVVIGDDGMLV